MKRHNLVLTAGLVLLFSAGSAMADNSLDVNANAAILGDFGLEVLIDGSANQTFVADTTPAAETVYRVQFRANPNNITMDNGTGHAIFFGRQGGGGGNVLRLTMQRLNDEYKVVCRIQRDGGGTYFCGKFTFAPVNTRIGVEWVAASAPGADDGIVRLRKGDTVQFERTDFDTDTWVIDTARFGLPKDADATTSGSFYLDDFASFRTLAP